MSSNINYPFSNCFHPIKVHHGDTYNYVPCGKCKACQLNKSNRNTFLCQLEEQDNKYCYFVTLTYDNDHLPIAKLSYKYADCVPKGLPTNKFVVLQKIPRVYREPYERTLVNDYQRADSEYHYFNSLKRLTGYESAGVKYDYTDVSITPFDPHYDYDKFISKCKCNGYIPYLSRYDLQLFLKRFRYYLSKETDEKVRHYSVGEYGPQHFRPHFHILVYFNEEKTLQAFEQALFKAWTFGRVDFSLSRGHCNSYVAKYVNCNSVIPRLLASRSIKPFAVHSTHFAESLYKSQKAKVYSDAFIDFIKQSRVVNGKYLEFLPWRTLALKFFPKCRGFNDISSSQLYVSYTLYLQARDYYKETSSVKLAEYVSRDIYRHHYTIGFIEPLYNWYHNEYMDSSQMFDMVYRMIHQSKYFYYFCCDGDERLISKRLEQIREFWKVYDYYLLTLQYDSQSYVFEHPDEYQDIDYYHWYDNADSFFYPHKINKLKNTAIYQMWHSQVSHLFESSGKHKELNDLNYIFL